MRPPFNRAFFLLLLSTLCHLLPLSSAQPFDYPTARASTEWTNSPSLKHTVRWSDGVSVRAILLRGSIGPSFACGFFCTGTCNSFLFSVFIAYTNSGSLMTGPSPLVVWSANRDRPIGENATLRFSEDGDLVLRDADGSAVWSTNTSGKSVVGMSMTDKGDLVLVDEKNASVWSSMDHPTDSWVLGQTLRQGQRLTANVSASSSTRGLVYLDVVGGGFEAYVGDNPPQLYYRDVDTVARNGTTAITFTNGSLTIFTPSNDSGSSNRSIPLTPAQLLQYIRLDYGGHLRLYEFSMTGWKLLRDVFSIFPDDCSYPTVCGENGICSNGQCSCPATYFRPVDERQPNLGCSPVDPLACKSNQTHQLLALKNVSYFNYIMDADIPRTSEESCKQACLSNCLCKAALFQYGGNASDGSCFLPSRLFSMKNNVPDITHYNSSAYIKVQIQNSSFPSRQPDLNVGFIVGVTLGALFGASLVAGVVFVVVRRKKSGELEEEDQFDMLPGIPARFSYEDLKLATENFCRKLGEGGFGSVFEGTLIDGTRVAVKRLDSVGQGKKEFLAEVETIGSIHHINLVRLIGFCAEKSYRLLVYEYMCNGSLDKWIFYKGQENVLQWQMRRQIITDIAKGLCYLHQECRQKIVHLDIKPQNILLDDKFNAKVSDFGLSKLIDRDQSQVMTRMRGTPGYLAPEWLTSVITEKADVYSFGVVVLEIVCGRKNLDYSQQEEHIHLISLLKDKVEENRLPDLIDSHGTDMQQQVDEITEVMRLAMWCLQSVSNDRPSMSVVVKVLEGSMNVETDIDYKFTNPAPFLPRNANNDSSPPPSASLLSGPR